MTKARDAGQQELFQADVSWFHMFKELIKTKTWAKMSAPAKALYPTIKAFTNWKDGRSFPSIDTLEEYSGLARASVIKALGELEGLGYISSIKTPGKKTVYKLIERFEIQGEDGRPVASASFDYLPGIVQDATVELKNYVAKGLTSDGTMQHIHIDKFVIENLTIVSGSNNIGTQINQVDGGRALQDIIDSLDSKTTVDNSQEKRSGGFTP